MTYSIRVAAIAGVMAISLSSPTWAQDSGVNIDPDVFNMYLESRTQRPAAQATAQEIAAVREQLTDVYLLSDQPRAAELQEEQPRLKAQIELQRRAMIAQAVATDFVANNPATDEELQALYADAATQEPTEEYKARHILVQMQAEAIALIAALDSGADFQELAQVNSLDSSGPAGGDLGWFPDGAMVPEFSQAVIALANGEYTATPVQTQFGWHVILREDSRVTPPPPFESIREQLKQQVESEKLQAYLTGLRESPGE